MATKTRKRQSCALTREQARRLFDRQARKYLNMSGEKFVQKWDAGKFNGESDSAKVLHVAMLLPFAR
jgi:hypothetical protein